MTATAKKFQKQWALDNQNIIHIPSVYEVDLMEAYAAQKSARLTIRYFEYKLIIAELEKIIQKHKL